MFTGVTGVCLEFQHLFAGGGFGVLESRNELTNLRVHPLEMTDDHARKHHSTTSSIFVLF